MSLQYSKVFTLQEFEAYKQNAILNFKGDRSVNWPTIKPIIEKWTFSAYKVCNGSLIAVNPHQHGTAQWNKFEMFRQSWPVETQGDFPQNGTVIDRNSIQLVDVPGYTVDNFPLPHKVHHQFTVAKYKN